MAAACDGAAATGMHDGVILAFRQWARHELIDAIAASGRRTTGS
ncbi:hypothetical protein [Nonomuraea deserti]|nr:hypothetical protein [Nonomuraea deserti]